MTQHFVLFANMIPSLRFWEQKSEQKQTACQRSQVHFPPFALFAHVEATNAAEPSVQCHFCALLSVSM